MDSLLTIDGSHGEGGGQVLRTSLSLSAITGRAIRIGDIRRARAKPGLAAQHVTAVRAVAALCDARLAGVSLGSTELEFAPQCPVRAGAYSFDVAMAREGGSAGATSLVLQAVLVPLARAAADSTIALRGGTHVEWSPPFDYVREVWLPALGAIGIRATVEAPVTGWYPAGQGEVRATVEGLGSAGRGRLTPLDVRERGPLRRIFGRAMVANLHENIAARMAARSRQLIEGLDAEVAIEPVVVRAACAGAGTFLTAEYEHVRCGFSALGRRGKPAEVVAEEAATALLAHHRSGTALDVHLADQILVPMALAAGTSWFTVERASGHLETNAWVIGQFDIADIEIAMDDGGAATVTVDPKERPE